MSMTHSSKSSHLRWVPIDIQECHSISLDARIYEAAITNLIKSFYLYWFVRFVTAMTLKTAAFQLIPLRLESIKVSITNLNLCKLSKTTTGTTLDSTSFTSNHESRQLFNWIRKQYKTKDDDDRENIQLEHAVQLLDLQSNGSQY